MAPLEKEDQFFVERDAQLRNRLRAEMEAKAQAATERQKLAAQLLGNEQLAERLHDLGFDAETAPALHLLPLVAVAWADGRVSDRERRAVMQVAEMHNIQPGSKAGLLLASMLEKKPSKDLIEQIESLLHDLLAAKGLHPHSLVEACVDVASVSGGFLGLGSKVSAQEQALIESLSRTFDKKSQDEVVDKLD